VVCDYFYTFLKCYLYYTVVVFVNVYLLESKQSSSTFAAKKKRFFCVFMCVFLFWVDPGQYP
jgi:hypothetical protein